MGSNLLFVDIFGTTSAPTKSPTFDPTFNPTISPFIKCQNTNKNECKNDIRCIWKKVKKVQKCFTFDCASFTNVKSCKKYKDRCKWEKNKCVSFK